MSTRSASNKRTQAHEVTGVARKSAASAKPARAAASSVRVQPATAKDRRKKLEKGESLEGLTKQEKKARKQELRAEEDRRYTASTILLKQDEDYTKRRRVWWALLGAGMLIIIALWIWLFGLSGNGGKVTSGVQMAAIVVAYAVIIAAFVYDFTRIRPIRNMYRDQVEGMSTNKLNALIERAAAEEDRKRAEKEAAKEDKK